MEVKGRDLVSGIPKTVRVHSSEIREAVQEPIQQIVDAVRRALEITPPELASDIVDRGIIMTGGGALIRGLDILLAQETGLPIHVDEDPLTCVVRGAGRILDDYEKYRSVLYALTWRRGRTARSPAGTTPSSCVCVALSVGDAARAPPWASQRHRRASAAPCWCPSSGCRNGPKNPAPAARSCDRLRAERDSAAYAAQFLPALRAENQRLRGLLGSGPAAARCRTSPPRCCTSRCRPTAGPCSSRRAGRPGSSAFDPGRVARGADRRGARRWRRTAASR